MVAYRLVQDSTLTLLFVVIYIVLIGAHLSLKCVLSPINIYFGVKNEYTLPKILVQNSR